MNANKRNVTIPHLLYQIYLVYSFGLSDLRDFADLYAQPNSSLNNVGVGLAAGLSINLALAVGRLLGRQLLRRLYIHHEEIKMLCVAVKVEVEDAAHQCPLANSS